MANKKILTVCGVLLAMGLTACGAKTNPSGGSGGGNSNSGAAHTHVWNDGVVTTPATCEEPGVKTYTCTGEGTCPNNNTKTEAIPATGHQFGDATKVDKSGADDVDYYTALCSVDSALKLSFPTEVGGVYEGTERKSNTPTGYTKLKGNGSISWKINLAGSKVYKGKMYHVATMDAFESNKEKNYGYYTTSSSDTRPEGNFNFYVNGKLTDKSAYMNISFDDLTKGGENDPELDKITSSPGPYGPVALCPIADDVYIRPGENVFKYERTGSYNMVMRELVFIGKEFDEWGPAQDVAGETGYVSYKKYESNIDNSIKLEIRALDGAFDQTTDPVSQNKDGTEEGYLKLNKDGNRISWKFKYDSAAVGQLHQIGFMDSFSSNHDVLYSWTSTSGDHAPTFEGNLRATINGNKIDRSPYMNIRAEDLTKNGDNTVFEASKNYSPLTLLPVGGIVLNNGDNTIVFERLGSYNYVASTLVLIIKNSATPFVVEDTLSADDNAHFNKVTGTDVRFNAAAHELVADTSKADVPASCTAEGKQYKKCSVCNHEIEIKVEKLPHTWISDPDLASTDTASTCTVHGVAHMKCSVCGAKDAQELPLAAHTWGEPGTKINGATPYTCTVCSAKCYVLEFTDANADGVHAAGKFNSGSASWNITGIDAGNYELYAFASAKSSSLNTEFGSRYFWNVDDAKIEANKGTYAEYGFGTGENTTDFKWTTKSAATVTIAATSALFKMSFQSYGSSACFGALRLVKIAA